MRDRLIELIQNSVNGCARHWADVIAGHLLANGVIVPRVKVGQTIYRCDFILHKVIDWSIVRIDIYEDEVVYCDDCFNVFTDEEIGEGVFLTREEAERALKGGAE